MTLISLPTTTSGIPESILVNCPHKGTGHLLEEFFIQYLDRITATPLARHQVDVRITPGITARAVDGSATQLVLYDRPCWIVRGVDTQTLLCPGSFQCTWDSTGKKFSLEAEDADRAYIEGRCLIRACIERAMFARGFVLLHGAVVISPDQDGILILGDKGAGKTTTTLTLVNRGFTFLENDRVFVLAQDNTLVAAPRPAFVRVGAETHRRIPFLKNHKGTITTDHQGKIVYDRFIATHGVPFSSIGRVRAVVIADIFKKKPTVSRDQLLDNAILTNIPGFAALHAYFPGQVCQPNTERISDRLRGLPVFVQQGPNLDDLLKFVHNLRA